MERCKRTADKIKEIFVGVDLHKKAWHVTVLTMETQLFSGSIPGKWEALSSLLEPYKGGNIKLVYEAGCFGFWLHDRLLDWGADCIVTPPSLVLQEHGNRVKTDCRDSRKLAHLLSKGLLKRVWVPTEEECFHRKVSRLRRQLIGDRIRMQNRITSELSFCGIDITKPKGKWSKIYVENLRRVRFKNRWMQESFELLLEQYDFINEQIVRQTKLLRELSETELYKENVKILRSAPGIGIIIAMEILLELQDVSRFRRSGQLAAYVGLTPSQYSSGDKVRMGRITRIGKSALRGSLIQASWILISKDGAMREKYECIKARAGNKRAIVAVARILLLRIRRMLLDKEEYTLGLIS